MPRCPRVAALPLLPFLVLLSAGSARSQELPEHPDHPSAFVTVISARDYDDRFETVEDLLHRSVGVRVRRFGGLGAFSTASIRGSKPEQVLVLLDGVRLNSAHRGAVDLSSLSLRSIERIEIVRGGGAARYGSAAVGGVIAITTRDAEAGSGVDVAARGGSLRTLGGDLHVARDGDRAAAALTYSRLRSENDFRFDVRPGGLGGPLGGGVFALIPSSRHTRRNAGFVEDTAAVHLDLDGDPTRALELTAHGFRKDSGQPGTLLGRRLVNATDDLLSCGGPEEQYRRALVSARWRERALGGPGPGRRGALELALHHRYERRELYDPDHGRPGTGCGLVDRDLVGRVRAQAIETQTGAELRYAGPAWRGPGVVAAPRASASLRVDGVRADDSDSRRRWTAGLFAQQDVRLFRGALRLIPALGWEAARTGSGLARSAQFAAVREVDVEDDAAWLPRLGAIARVTPWLRVKANAQRAYRRPTFTELFHPDYGFVRGEPALRPERSWNLDAGLELALGRAGPLRRLSLEAAAFRRDVDESIEWILLGTVFKPVNTGAALVRGYELRASLDWGDRADLAASYTFVDTEIARSGTPLPHTPRNQLFLHGGLRLGPARLWIEYAYEDELALEFTGVLVAPPARQVDAGVSLRPAALPGLGWLPDRLSVTSEWVNLRGAGRIDSLGLPLPDQTVWYLTLRSELR